MADTACTAHPSACLPWFGCVDNCSSLGSTPMRRKSNYSCCWTLMRTTIHRNILRLVGWSNIRCGGEMGCGAVGVGVGGCSCCGYGFGCGFDDGLFCRCRRRVRVFAFGDYGWSCCCCSFQRRRDTGTEMNSRSGISVHRWCRGMVHGC